MARRKATEFGGNVGSAESAMVSADISQSHETPIWDAVDNPNLKALPNHLKQFIVDQQYDKYTPVDHAVWRYVMRQNYAFLKDYAHEAYVSGLKKTGIGIDKIPSIHEMNEILSKIGWACVTVDGFIPPAAFMEYQAYKVLVIAADMRQLHHIEYTPAPDIIHEAAGHAPIIADPEYAEYLKRFGEIGSKAMSSKKDYELYEAIRHLSIIKELPDADPAEVARAEKEVEERQKNLGKPSEMAQLSRMHWWTVEYGLVGDVKAPRIYGAGLLSSIGESANCLTDAVDKIDYDVKAADYAFDITTQQPHLFVTKDFSHLLAVLDEFAATMAFRVGGLSGLKKAIECANVCTAVYSSGLQVSGVIAEVRADENKNPAYIRIAGPASLAFENKQLEGHGKDFHADGFGSPVGKLRGVAKPIEDMTDRDLNSHDIAVGERCNLDFASGVKVDGILQTIIRKNKKIVILTFEQCKVTLGNDTLFDPTWGIYDMAVGEKITSVFCGAADKDAYNQVSLVPKERTVKSEFDATTRALHDLYAQVRHYRDAGATDKSIVSIWKHLQRSHPNDWLAPLEILEILSSRDIFPEITVEIRVHLERMAVALPHLKKLINQGINLVDNPVMPV